MLRGRRSVRGLAVSFAILALAVPGCRAEAESGTVVEVIDGDTIVVALPEGRRKVRLLGVDTPELGREDHKAEAMGQEAAAFTRSLAHGQVVRLVTDSRADERDVYGRALRYVFLPDGRLLNLLIVAEGFGQVYTRSDFERIEEFRAAERAARESGRGLWGADALHELSADEAAAHVGAVARVCGAVASTHYAADTRGRPTFLNLGRPYPHQLLTVVIWGADRDRFKAPEKRYADQHVCVTGEIETRNGKPQIVVDDPTQISLQTEK